MVDVESKKLDVWGLKICRRAATITLTSGLCEVKWQKLGGKADPFNPREKVVKIHSTIGLENCFNGL